MIGSSRIVWPSVWAFHAFLLLITLFALSGILTVAGVNLSRHDVVELPIMSGVPPSDDPFDPFWESLSAAKGLAPVFFARQSRTISIKTAQQNGVIYLLIEWPDDTEDLSFHGPKEHFEQEELFRDEMDLLIASVERAASPYATISAASGEKGYLAWRSQWETYAEKQPLADIHERYPRDYVDYYPFDGNLTFLPPLAVGNTNTIYHFNNPVMWLTGRPFHEYRETEIAGRGAWQDNTWRVFLRLEVGRDIDPLTGSYLMVRLADGGKDERKSYRAISQPFLLKPAEVR